MTAAQPPSDPLAENIDWAELEESGWRGPRELRAIHRKWSPLGWAVWMGLPDVVAELLAAGVSPTEPLHNGFMPLMLACQPNRLPASEEVVYHLLAAGADPNHGHQHQTGNQISSTATNTARGTTPLMWAARDNPELVPALLEGGASVEPRNAEGLNARDFAASGGYAQEFDRAVRQFQGERSAAVLTETLPAAASVTRPRF